MQAGKNSLLNLYVLDMHGTRLLIVTRAESSASLDLAGSAAFTQVTSILDSIVWPIDAASRPTATAP